MNAQKIVLCGILIENPEEDLAYIVNAFKEEGLEVKYIDRFDTLPGQGGAGGRTDVVMEMTNGIAKAAVHPWHLNGLFRWAEDYFENNREIVPGEKYGLFQTI